MEAREALDGLDWLLGVFAFFMGASIGSFLNVCIYRMPRDLSVNNPRRSFCPKCEYQIPWYRNLPLISWLQLRGKCANCGAPIAFRYFGVELLTGLLFLAVWLREWPGQWVLALPYWIFAAGLVVATFIDFEFFIIPDEITWGGAAAGVLLSAAIPALHGEHSPVLGAAWALVGGVLGYGLLWAVVELGKLAFGKKMFRFEKPEELSWVRDKDEAAFKIGEEEMLWSEIFARTSDRIRMKCEGLTVDGEALGKVDAVWELDWMQVGERRWELEKTDAISGKVTEVILPREAMGFGDVKFMAAIGAFLGWQAVLFTLVSASVAGALVGGLSLLVRRRDWSGRIPFGPYLALGALAWIFVGRAVVQWYLGLAFGASGV